MKKITFKEFRRVYKDGKSQTVFTENKGYRLDDIDENLVVCHGDKEGTWKIVDIPTGMALLTDRRGTRKGAIKAYKESNLPEKYEKFKTEKKDLYEEYKKERSANEKQ